MSERVATALDHLEAVFGELESALKAADEAWERVPAPGEWAPRLVAEHIVSAWVIYLDFAADALGRDAFDWEKLPYEFTTAKVGLDGLSVVRAFANSLLEVAADPDLDLDVPAMEDWPNLPNTVEGALGYVEHHGRMHARQIRDAVNPTKL
ncbi:MAG TPA: DinB family protein [Dehalococcoidia bacterium]|nr:DinB family protein [Dehalococcoidia bacterium]